VDGNKWKNEDSCIMKQIGRDIERRMEGDSRRGRKDK
jgi:hypothetical protein